MRFARPLAVALMLACAPLLAGCPPPPVSSAKYTDEMALGAAWGAAVAAWVWADGWLARRYQAATNPIELIPLDATQEQLEAARVALATARAAPSADLRARLIDAAGLTLG